MIESVKIKFATGKEIELTGLEAQELMFDLSNLLEQGGSLPTYPPVSVPFVQTPNWWPLPYKTTCGSTQPQVLEKIEITY